MQVATWLSELVPPPRVAPELIEQLRAHLDERATGVIAELPDDLLPLRLPKSRLADLERCERSAVARWQQVQVDDSMTDAALRGMAVDRFVAHQLAVGRVLEPVEALRSMLVVEAEWSALAHLDALDPLSAAELIDPLAAVVAEAWVGIAEVWEPRAQARAMLVLADGAVVSSSVVDVELGGPSTTLPAVVIEVKSGRPVASHQSEAYLYGLLVALRDGVAPVEVARWYPGAPPAGLAVSEGLLESAGARLEDGIARWAELLRGRPPAESPGAWCRWCPDAAHCPSAESVATAGSGAGEDGDADDEDAFDEDRDG